jgi:hypothetical protein
VPDGSGDARIPLLAPWGLDVVPGWTAETEPEWRHRYYTWRERVLPIRTQIRALCERDPEARGHELIKCASDYKYWLSIWANVYEPRPRRDRLTGAFEAKHKPFIPFAFQCHVGDWMRAIEQEETPSDFYVTKARGIGLSWMAVAETVWGWLFDDVTTLLMSRTQSEVDKPNNINTLFGKATYLIGQLPSWMLPDGFSLDGHRTQLNIQNPATSAQIFGETTNMNVGIGDRAQKAIVDEAAAIRGLKRVYESLSGTTDHIGHISTESIELGFEWRNAWQAAYTADPEKVMILNWPLNPYNDEVWYANTRARFEASNNLAGFYAQIERNPLMGNTGIVYPEAQTVTWAPDDAAYDASLPVLGSIDPGFADATAIVWAQPTDGTLHGRGAMRFIDSYERSKVPAEWYAHILTGIPPEPGDTCHGLHISERERQLMAWTRALPSNERTRYLMDPAGTNKDTSGQSFYLRLYRESKRLRERAGDSPAKPIVPIYKELFPLRQYQPRHQASRGLLARCDFLHNPGCRRLVECLQEHRETELTAKSTRGPVPIHDETMDLVSAFEFLAVYCDAGYARIPEKKADPMEEAA